MFVNVKLDNRRNGKLDRVMVTTRSYYSAHTRWHCNRVYPKYRMIKKKHTNVANDPAMKTTISPLPLRSMKLIVLRDKPRVLAAERSLLCVPVLRRQLG